MKSIFTFRKSIFLILICSASYFSCDNDEDSIVSNLQNQNQDPDPVAFAENFGNEISRRFLGSVVDSNNNPLNNVVITIGDSFTSTDDNGVFIINEASVNQRFAYVKAEKDGYIHASRAVVPNSGTNSIRIMMLPETIAGTTASGTQETIALPNGASVALKGDYIKEDGSTYSGNVNVILHHLDPTDENMQDQMPGMLYAANAQNEERMLQTFGMLAVELHGSSGEDLNLAEGSTAEIKVPLDPSLVSNAPATIPLWYFDETHGYWIEDGQATLVGNTYIGSVSHFSFWNCDIPAEAVNLCVTVTYEDNSELAHAWVTITSNTYGTRGGYTNSSGEVCGLIPSGESLEVNIYPNGVGDCESESIYSSVIGPYSEDSSITLDIIDTSSLNFETVFGNFNACDGNPIEEGYVLLNYANTEFSDYVDNGEFEFSFLRCNDEDTFYLQGYDYINIQQTDSIAYTFTPPVTNIGTLSACNTVEEFITYQYGDESPVSYYFDVQGGLDGDYLTISYYSQDNNLDDYFNLYINPFSGANSYTNGYLDFFNQDTGGTTLESMFSGTISVTSFGAVGEYIDVNFSGEISEYGGDPIPISGTAHILRDY
ncbi:hypothetical protein [uncultured Psychroserpens sp.]|uniref:hypothetical protein n=1 Tax=uncultured Psychroserpens sp. TaxID=255436 RepID=UPI0026355F0D|nr:hypothetical protein [uncultured Psychroserpens sp.]